MSLTGVAVGSITVVRSVVRLGRIGLHFGFIEKKAEMALVEGSKGAVERLSRIAGRSCCLLDPEDISISRENWEGRLRILYSR